MNSSGWEFLAMEFKIRSSARRVGVGRSASGGDFVAKYTKYITTCSFRYHYIIDPIMEPQPDILSYNHQNSYLMFHNHISATLSDGMATS